MASDQALADEISRMRKALLDLEQVMLSLDPQQRAKLEEVRLHLKLSLEAAPSSCSCAKSPSQPQTCSITGIRIDPA